jgi:hypothetical protein
MKKVLDYFEIEKNPLDKNFRKYFYKVDRNIEYT